MTGGGNGIQKSSFREYLHEVIFGHETPEGKLFDVVLLWIILFSVVAVLLESVQAIREDYQRVLFVAEWIVTILFTVEYGVRIYCCRSIKGYTTSFYGVIDLLSVLPSYLSFFFTGAQYLMVVRILRLLRVFRILKLARYLDAADILTNALRASRAKIIVFLGSVLIMVVIIGALMYLIEGEQSGFTSIPRSIYWAIVTMTTVGYGDIAPTTVFGQLLASIVMIIGYGIIAVPTGIVSVELYQAAEGGPSEGRICSNCSQEDHDTEAIYCKICGALLPGKGDVYV